MNSFDIACFMASTRTESFSAAAKELDVSQQLVSKHIKSIEAELGFSVFYRRTNNLVLTDKGAKFFTLIKSLNDDIVWGGDGFSKIKQLFPHIVFCDFLGSVPQICHVMIQMKAEGSICDWRQSILSLDDICNGLERHTIDVAFVPEPVATELSLQSNYCSMPPFFRISLRLMAPRRLKVRSDENPLPFLYCDMGHRMSEYFLRCCSNLPLPAGLTRNGRQECYNWSSVFSNVMCGGGYTLSAFFGEDPRENGLLSISDTNQYVHISALWLQSNSKGAVIKSVLKRISEEVQ